MKARSVLKATDICKAELSNASIKDALLDDGTRAISEPGAADAVGHTCSERGELGSKRFVELNRRFVQHREDGDAAIDAALLVAFGSEHVRTWDQLLELSTVVVLGEAGTGKTREFEHQATKLRSEDCSAFFLRVEDIASYGVRDAFQLGDESRFDAWLVDDGPGWFFLDAVDESKLRGQRLEQALRQLARGLGSALPRARLLLSCRVSDWASEERRALLKLLVYRGDGAETPKAEVVRLVALESRQTRQLVKAEGVEDSDALLKAVSEAGAWPFAERPLDVIWLAAYWQEHGRLGGWTELVEYNVTKKLQERPALDPKVSVARATEGAAALACVSTLAQREGIALPESDQSRGDALEADLVLHDWSAAQIRELLRRGLFDEATYDRVRIHHRVAREFLAAQHLHGAITTGFPEADLDATFFPHHDGAQVAAPHLAPVGAWLAIDHEPTLRRMTELAPEHLIDEGDPARLSIEARRRVLHSYARRFGDRKRVPHYFARGALGRFADPGLAETIESLVREHDGSPHLLETLFEIVAAGKIRSCLPVVRDFVNHASEVVRRAALHAFFVASDETEIADAFSKMMSYATQDHATVGTVVRRCFPEHLSVDQLVALTCAAPPPGGGATSEVEYFFEHELPARVKGDVLSEILDGLIAGAFEDVEPDGKGRPFLRWAGMLICRLAEAVLVGGETGSASIKRLVEMLPWLRSIQNDAEHIWQSELQSLSHLRRLAFWHQVHAQERQGNPFPRSPMRVDLPWWLRLVQEDVSWLSTDAGGSASPRERLLAFRAVLHLSPQPRAEDPRVTELAKEDPDLELHLCRFERWQEGNDPLTMTHPASRMHQRRDVLRQRWMNKKEEKKRRELKSHIEAIRSGTHEGDLVLLYRVGKSRGGTTDFSEAVLCDAYGQELTEAAMTGFRRFWHHHEPARIEDQSYGGTRHSVGILGISLEIANGLDLAALEHNDLQKVIRYGAWKLNGFPDWMTRCAELRPELVGDTYGPCLAQDFNALPAAPGQHPWDRLLSKLRGAAPELQKACAPSLVALLDSGDPPSTEILGRVLEILDGAGRLGDLPASLYARRAASALGDDGDTKRYATWWRHWLQVDAEGALDGLQDELGRRDGSASQKLLLEVCEAVWDRFGREVKILDPIRKQAPLAAKFSRLLFRHIRPESDLHHQGAYSPEPRDHAQHLRNSTLSWVADSGPVGLVELRAMLDEPDFSDVADWIKEILDSRKRSVLPMSVEDAIALVNRGVLVPRTNGQLFQITTSRLDAVIEKVERGTFSTRAVYNPGEGHVFEEPVQLLIAQELDDARRGQYTVTRESQDAQSDKPDICVAADRIDAPTVIEIKVAERWSYNQLLDGLRTQLVAKYLRAEPSRSGIYLLCSSGAPRANGWRTPDGTTVDFRELVAALQTEADIIVAKRLDIDELVVRALDFHGPTTTHAHPPVMGAVSGDAR